MYLKYYNLKRPPFNLTADPAFLWAGKKHREALDTLKEGILNDRGFVILTGEVGTGKTTLINTFSSLNEIATITVTIPDPDLETLDLFNYLASEFGMGRKFDSRQEFEHYFKGFLLSSYATYKKVLVIIDEAQRLNPTLIEAIRQLANLEMAGRRMLKIFFVGQPEFADMLMDESNAAAREEVVAASHLEPLEARETAEYIIHRLAVAGSKSPPFTPRAILRIYSITGGYPRTVNVLCDHCLLKGFASGTQLIDVDIVAACAGALQLKPLATRPREHGLPFTLKPAEYAVIEVGAAKQGPRRRRRVIGVMAAAAILIASGGLAYYLKLPAWLMALIRGLMERMR